MILWQNDAWCVTKAKLLTDYYFLYQFVCIDIATSINRMNRWPKVKQWTFNDKLINSSNVLKSLISLFRQLISEIHIHITYTDKIYILCDLSFCHVTFKQTFDTCFMPFIWSTFVKWSKREGHFYVIFALEFQITYYVYSCRFDGKWRNELQNVMKEFFFSQRKSQ